MIEGKQSRIRGIERDDAAALQRFYDPQHPRASLLDNRMEPALPTRDELRELLGKDGKQRGQLFAVEEMDGRIAGFCSLRGAQGESNFAEAALLLNEDDAYEAELAGEALEFLKARAFIRQGLNKIFAQCLESEAAFRACLLRHGFTSDGARREAFHSGGRMHDVEALSFFARDYNHAGGNA